MAPPVLINLKTMDSLKKGYEVLDSQYLLANSDSPKIINVKFKQWSTIRIRKFLSDSFVSGINIKIAFSVS